MRSSHVNFHSLLCRQHWRYGEPSHGIEEARKVGRRAGECFRFLTFRRMNSFYCPPFGCGFRMLIVTFVPRQSSLASVLVNPPTSMPRDYTLRHSQHQHRCLCLNNQGRALARIRQPIHTLLKKKTHKRLISLTKTYMGFPIQSIMSSPMYK
jgi:hypothetical protein